MVFIIIAIITSCGNGSVQRVSNETNTSLGTYNKVIKEGKIRIGYLPYPPGFIEDPNTKALSGIFYEIDTLLAKRLNIKFEFVEKIPWSDIAVALENNRFDIIASPVWPTIERAKFCEFSIPVYYETLNAYVRADDKRFDNNLAAINRPDVRIATIVGEISAIIKDRDFHNAKAVVNIKETQLSQICEDIISNKADVVFTSPMLASKYLKSGKIKEIEGIGPLNVYPNVMVMRKGDFALKTMFDNALLELHNTGVIDKIISKYEEVPGIFYRVQQPYIKK